MTITNGYATLAQVKSRLDITDNDNDAELESVITGVSRAIDANRGRRIYAATETRYYTPQFTDWLIVHDLLSLTTLKTDSTGNGTFDVTWTSSDYFLEPINAALDGEPYDQITITTNGDYTFDPVIKRSVEIAGSFGYAATTPPEITEACILVAMRVWKRRDILFGTSGNAELGTVEAIAPLLKDGEFKMLLDSVPMRII
jgi:hypothetical protein